MENLIINGIEYRPIVHITNAHLIRTYSAGVHIGEIVEKRVEAGICIVTLKNSKRIWRWEGACSLSQLAQEGSKNITGCKITIAVDSIELFNVIEIIPLSDIVKTQLYEAAEWKI